MARKETTLAVRLPEELVAQLERLAQETGRSKSDYARQAIIEFLEDRTDYRRAVATLEKNEPRLSLEEAKRALGLKIEFERDAIRQLDRLDGAVRRRIVEYLEQRVVASGNPRQFGKPLSGRQAWPLVVPGRRLPYRCLLEDWRLVVAVVSVGHRRDVYR